MSTFQDVPADTQPTRFPDPEPLAVPPDAELVQDRHGVIRYFWDLPAAITKAPTA